MSDTDDHACHEAGAQLSREILDSLRQRAADKLKLFAETEDELDALAVKVGANMRLPADKAAYAIRLGYCLAPHFPTMKALAATRAFVTIGVAATDDPMAVGETLGDAVAVEGGRAIHNPTYRLHEEDRFVVLSAVAKPHLSEAIRIIAEAAERCLPVFGVIAAGAETPGALIGADLSLEMPAITRDMLTLLFEATHDEVPAAILQFSDADKLRTEDLVAHIRRGRSADDCLAGLQKTVSSRRPVPSASKVLLSDLAGYGEAKRWGLELAQDMHLWREGRLSWDEVDHRAVVLAGPPGTGKTSFASVLAATLGVPLIATSVAEWNGQNHLSGALQRMQAVFEEALAQAPCVLFIDELDGIASRSALEERHATYWAQIINRMLELVTEAMAKAGVVLVGATNHVERIDPALMRSGRLDQIIRIELPDAEAIVAILGRYVGGVIPSMDLNGLAKALVGRTGADIEKLVRAAKASARRASRVFSVDDLQQQVSDPLDGLPPRTQRRMAVYRNGQRIVAQILGLADMVVDDQHQDLSRLLAKGLSEERFPTEQVCDDVLAVILAGRAAEEIVFGDVSVFGAASPRSDLAAATAIATEMELKAGFGEAGLIYMDEPGRGSPLSRVAVGSVRRRLEGALARASALLVENIGELERLSPRHAEDRIAAGAALRSLN